MALLRKLFENFKLQAEQTAFKNLFPVCKTMAFSKNLKKYNVFGLFLVICSHN